MESETRLTSRLVKGGRLANAMILNMHGHGEQASGWPDIFVCHSYWSGWIEFKGRETIIRSNQVAVLKKLKSNIHTHTSTHIVRFLEQERNYWKMRVEDLDKRTLTIFEEEDTDIKVMVRLLSELRKLKNTSEDAEDS